MFKPVDKLGKIFGKPDVNYGGNYEGNYAYRNGKKHFF